MEDHDLFQARAYAFDLPQEQIAQNPVIPRHDSRLLVLHKETGEREHRHFRDVGVFLQEGDLLVLNDTKVLAARLFGTKAEGGARVEIFLLRPLEEKKPWRWEAMVRPGKRLKRETRVDFTEDVSVRVLPHPHAEGGLRVVEFPEDLCVPAFLERAGMVPLPPYITESCAEDEQYQTVFAASLGSVAAPTAGLHFTRQLMERLEGRGISFASLTLHIGLGTFRPVHTEDIRHHVMHEEYFEIPGKTVELIQETKARGGRVIAVGTTVVRSLETAAASPEGLKAGKGTSDLFIYPGFTFRVIDGMITNFHLPQSTLLMLVSALGGYRQVRRAYAEAVERKYRFYSFGDAMIIL